MYPWNCCRTCLNTRNLYPIFIIPAQSDKYTKVVHTVTGVTVKINDTMPQEMCLDCINFVNESIKFRRKCEEVQTMLLENRCSVIKLEKFQPDSEERLNAIDITDSYDDDFKDFDDNITLDTLQFHKVSNEDQVDRGTVTVNPANHFDEDTKTSEFYEASNKVCVESNKKIILNAAEHKFCSNKKDVLNTGKHMFDTNNKFIVETFDNNETDHVDSNDVAVENNFDCKNKTIDSEVKPVEYKRKRKIKVKTERKKKMKDEAVKVKEEIECEFCHKILTSKLSLRNHYKIHTGFDIVCEHCGKKFITRRLLLMHCRAKHGYEKTDKCSYCDYRASNAEQVKIHERLHTGEKPFVCKTCSAGFHRKSSYLQHVAIHLPDKTVQCDQCPARFKSVTLMRIHKNRHRPSPYTFKCGVCNNSFARRRNVARHLHRVHGLPPDDYIHRIKIH